MEKLYKKTKTGAIQEWSISVSGNVMTTRHGQVGGAIQEGSETISEGKNIGRANETTPDEQALAEALARHEKKIKSGYVLDPSGEGTELGGAAVMLAQSFDKQGHKVTFPALVNPKLDGQRCVAIWDGKETTLWTRTRKPITSMPHLVQELNEQLNGHPAITLDGELYNHEMFKTDFEGLVHLTRQETPCEGHEQVEYHVYDVIDLENINIVRQEKINVLLGHRNFVKVKPVEINIVNSKADMDKVAARHLSVGYEGSMVRNMNGKYIGNRSYDLQKIKVFQEEEFLVVGVEEGRGKLAGHVGAVVCQTADGTRFNAKPDGETAKLREMLKNPESVIGKKATIKFFTLTGKNSVPRFPIYKGVRDYE